MNKNLSQLKILYLIKTMDIGGAEKFTLTLSKYFSDKENNITVFSSGGIFVEELKKNNVKHIKSVYAKSGNLGGIRKELKNILSDENFDIIHSQHRIFLLPLKTLNTGSCKIIYTAHNYFNDIYQKIIFPDTAVAISPLIEKNLLNTTLINKKNIVRINNGTKLKSLQMKDRNTITLGFVGRLIKEKGIYQLINAVKEIQSDKIRLIICGNGTEMNTVSKIIIKENLSGRIEVLPPTINIDTIYDLLDVLILPTSLNEGLPISILEAMARGIIVIATPQGAISDVIIDNVTGLLLTDNSVKSIKEKINYLINNRDVIKKIRKNGYEKIKDSFSIDTMLKSYEELYTAV